MRPLPPVPTPTPRRQPSSNFHPLTSSPPPRCVCFMARSALFYDTRCMARGTARYAMARVVLCMLHAPPRARPPREYNDTERSDKFLGTHYDFYLRTARVVSQDCWKLKRPRLAHSPHVKAWSYGASPRYEVKQRGISERRTGVIQRARCLCAAPGVFESNRVHHRSGMKSRRVAALWLSVGDGVSDVTRLSTVKIND